MLMIGGAPADIFLRNWASLYHVRVGLGLRQWFSGLAEWTEIGSLFFYKQKNVAWRALALPSLHLFAVAAVEGFLLLLFCF